MATQLCEPAFRILNQHGYATELLCHSWQLETGNARLGLKMSFLLGLLFAWSMPWGFDERRCLSQKKKNSPKNFLNFLDQVLRRTKTRQISRMGRLLTHLTSVGDLGFSRCCSAWRSSPACTRKRPHPPAPACTPSHL